MESRSPRKLENKEHKDISPRRGRERKRQVAKVTEPPPLPDRNAGVSGVSRRLSDRKHEVMEGQRANIQQKIRRKSRRSSSLGPLLDGNLFPGHEWPNYQRGPNQIYCYWKRLQCRRNRCAQAQTRTAKPYRNRRCRLLNHRR